MAAWKTTSIRARPVAPAEVRLANDSRDLIYIQSTDLDRTVMTAQCVLAGMYPPKGEQVWNDHLEWQPIPVHAVPPERDNIYTGFAHCPAYNEEEQNVLKSKEAEAFHEKYAEVFKVLNENTGNYEHDFTSFYIVYSNLVIEQQRNLPLPDWAKSIFSQPISEAVGEAFALNVTSKKGIRLRAGLIMKNMVDDMTAKRQGEGRNVHVYSGHDDTLATMMIALGAYHPHPPPYAACLMVELREASAGHHVVMVFYRNSTLEEPHLLTIPGCAPACPLDQFICISEPLAISPDEWNEECYQPLVKNKEDFKLHLNPLKNE